MKGTTMTRQLIQITAVALAMAVFGGVGSAQDTNNSAAQAAKPNSHIKTKYNQSKDETTVTLKTLDLSGSMNKEMTRESEFGNLDLDVSLVHKGKQPGQSVDSATFRFKGLAKNPMWMHAQNFALIIDDATGLVIGPTSYTSSSQTFYLEEIMSIAIPYQAMQRIAVARTVALQLGTRTIRLTTNQLADLKAMAAMMVSASNSE
jgi:hypothetical protein